MAILINAYQISKAFSARALFKDLTFSIEEGDRIGLIGPNGAGKSTLLRILASQMTVDSGSLSIQRGLKVGFLEQVPLFKPGVSVLEAILEKGEEASHDWEKVARAQELISKFGLAEVGEDARVEKLSGGWKKRVALARELIGKPDLLLLDEPTNHLDVESIIWLEELIAGARFATLTITHDRVFLQKISNRIIELDKRHQGGLLNVKGDYASYLEVRAQMIASQERREVILSNTLRRETEWLRQGAKARTTKQQARIQRAGELAGTVEDLKFRNQVRSAQIDFQSTDRSPKKLLEAKGIGKSYGGKKIFENVDLLLTPGSRVGLLGKNGVGKSTLIRVLLGEEKQDQGEVKHSEHLKVAYFDQSREALDPDLSVAKTLCPVGDWVDYRNSKVHIKSYLDRFLFTQGQSEMAVGKLSGGEQSRLLIARLMLKEANLLVLDEPTNDLDLATLNVLEECLTEFQGAVVLVTHDRYFLDQVANQIIAFGDKADGKLLKFATLGQWEIWRDAQRDVETNQIKKGSGSSSEEAKTEVKGSPKKKMTFKDQFELQHIEAKILAAEETLAKVTADLDNPEIQTNTKQLSELTKKLSDAQTEVDRLYQRWSELETGK